MGAKPTVSGQFCRSYNHIFRQYDRILRTFLALTHVAWAGPNARWSESPSVAHHAVADLTTSILSCNGLECRLFSRLTGAIRRLATKNYSKNPKWA